MYAAAKSSGSALPNAPSSSCPAAVWFAFGCTARAWWGLLLSALVVSLFGCADSSDEPKPNPAYAAEFAKALADAPNDYVREVLIDGIITYAEIQDAQSRVVDCINSSDIGFSEVGYVSNEYGTHESLTLGYPAIASEDAVTDVVQGCELQWLPFDTLYRSTVNDPGNVGFHELVARCLVRHGVMPPGFTGENYLEAHMQYYDTYGTRVCDAKIGCGLVEIQIPPDAPPLKLPGGVPTSDPQVQACQTNPNS